MERPIGERVATVETEVDTLKEEITERIRPNVQAAMTAAQLAVLRIDMLEKAQMMMNDKVLPNFTETLEQIANQVHEIQSKVLTRSTDVGWVMRIVTFLLQGVVTPAALVFLAWAIAQK